MKYVQDPHTGNWWLSLGKSMTIGYWPKEIVPTLNQAATSVAFGGWTFNSPDGYSPPMGSGNFPSKEFNKVGYFSQIQTVNKAYKYVNLDQNSVEKFADNTSCYDATYWGNLHGIMDEVFSYGGSGGLCGGF